MLHFLLFIVTTGSCFETKRHILKFQYIGEFIPLWCSLRIQSTGFLLYNKNKNYHGFRFGQLSSEFRTEQKYLQEIRSPWTKLTKIFISRYLWKHALRSLLRITFKNRRAVKRQNHKSSSKALTIGNQIFSIHYNRLHQSNTGKVQ